MAANLVEGARQRPEPFVPGLPGTVRLRRSRRARGEGGAVEDRTTSTGLGRWWKSTAPVHKNPFLE